MPHFQVLMPGHDRARSLGHLAAAWIEHYYRHGDGDIRGDRYRLDNDFYDFTVDAYALDTFGRRLYKTCILCRPKGTAKSEYAAAVDLFEALGPCRFAGWAEGGEVYEDALGFTYEYLEGEPMGRPISDPIVRIMATEETQTVNTFGNVRAVLEGEGEDRSALADWFEGNRNVFSGTTGVKLEGGGRILISTAGSKSKDGGKETHGTADETHLYTGGLAEMYKTVKRNLNKRKAAEPWLLTTTTMYRDGEGSIAEQQHKQAMAIAAGKKANPQMLFDHREGSPITDLSNEKELRASLREAYAGREWIDYDGMVNDVMDGTENPADFRRYFLNQVAGSDETFVTSTELAAITSNDDNPVEPLAPKDVITIGLDYAPGNRGSGRTKGRRKYRVPDATAAVACRLSDMSLHPLGIWEADEQTALREGWNPPMLEIEQTIDEAFKKYTVVGMYADPTGIESYLDRWTQKHLAKLKVRASTDRPMYRYMSGKSATRSGKDIDALYDGIAEQQLRLMADLTFIQHFLNARRAVSKFGTALFKDNPDSPRKIDAAIAAALAYAAAKDAINKGVQTTAAAVGIFRRIR